MIDRIAVSKLQPFPLVLQYTEVRAYIVTIIFVLLDVAVPWVFHQFHLAGPTFLPMHIFVFIAGLLFGWRVGLIVGLNVRALIAGMDYFVPTIGTWSWNNLIRAVLVYLAGAGLISLLYSILIPAYFIKKVARKSYPDRVDEINKELEDNVDGKLLNQHLERIYKFSLNVFRTRDEVIGKLSNQVAQLKTMEFDLRKRFDKIAKADHLKVKSKIQFLLSINNEMKYKELYKLPVKCKLFVHNTRFLTVVSRVSVISWPLQLRQLGREEIAHHLHGHIQAIERILHQTNAPAAGRYGGAVNAQFPGQTDDQFFTPITENIGDTDYIARYFGHLFAFVPQNLAAVGLGTKN